MIPTISELLPMAPEIVLLTAACVVLIVDLMQPDGGRRLLTYSTTLVGLVLTIAAVLYSGSAEREIVLAAAYVRDPMSDVLKVSILGVAILVFVYAKDYLFQRGIMRGEFFTLGLFSVLGMLIMVSANNFLVVYLGLELLALCLYALVAFDRDSGQAAEAAMKYFVLGAVASGMLLYGISMIYGVTGTLGFAEVADEVARRGTDDIVLVFGLVFVVIGIAFKFGAVPFHMWMPDVYQGAPTAVVLLLGSAPKIAAFALAMRMLVDGLGLLQAEWRDMLMILAVLSLAIGNVVAIAQENIKRMFAYSTISHVGFIFLGLLAGTPGGYAAAMFYAIVYALTAAGGFGVLTVMSHKGFDAENIADLKGLNRDHPWLAGMMLLLIFSMAGVPPTVGFFAKLFVLEAIVRIDLVWLAVYAVFFSIIGAYYYLRVVKVMYFDHAEQPLTFDASLDARIAVSINGSAMLLLGMFPAVLFSWCQTAFGAG